jgi:hypothetical protein
MVKRKRNEKTKAPVYIKRKRKRNQRKLSI